jgi:phage terminase Nu1 subunit (DNA packaging protein)
LDALPENSEYFVINQNCTTNEAMAHDGRNRHTIKPVGWKPASKLMMNSEVLNSWKEIAAYLGRGVRTVQRWEQELGLPVRRPRGKDRSAVIALKSDLDRWLQRAPNHGKGRAEEFKRRSQVLAQKIMILHQRANVLARQSEILRERITYAIRLTSQLPHRQQKTLHVSRTEFISDGVNGEIHPALIEAPPGRMRQNSETPARKPGSTAP